MSEPVDVRVSGSVDAHTPDHLGCLELCAIILVFVSISACEKIDRIADALDRAHPTQEEK